MNAIETACRAFADADDRWSVELQRMFGKHAGDFRYTSKGSGAVGSTLRAAHDAFVQARINYETAMKVKA